MKEKHRGLLQVCYHKFLHQASTLPGGQVPGRRGKQSIDIESSDGSLLRQRGLD